MGAAGPIWVFLTLLAPGVLGELGMGSRREGRVWGPGWPLCHHAKEAVKSEKVGRPCLLLARSLWGTSLGPEGLRSLLPCWGHQHRRLHDGMALCDLSSGSWGVTCPLCAARTQHVLSAMGPAGLRALMPRRLSETCSECSCMLR